MDRNVKDSHWDMNINKVAHRYIGKESQLYFWGVKKWWMLLVWSLAHCLAACMCVDLLVAYVNKATDGMDWAGRNLLDGDIRFIAMEYGVMINNMEDLLNLRFQSLVLEVGIRGRRVESLVLELPGFKYVSPNVVDDLRVEDSLIGLMVAVVIDVVCPWVCDMAVKQLIPSNAGLLFKQVMESLWVTV